MEETTVRPNSSHVIRNDTSHSAATSTRVVRVNWLKFLFYSWKRISRVSRLIVAFSILLVFVQVATAIVILIISTGESCDQPLQTFIIVYMIRIMLSCPFQVGEHFQRAEQRLSIQRRQARDRRRQQQVRLRRLRRREERQQRARQQQQQQAEEGSGGPGSVTPDPPFINETLMPSNASIASTVVQPRSNFITDWGERFKSLVDIFAVLWFIVGNYLLFTSKTCSRDAPQLFYTSLAFILIGYFIIILPLLLCTSVILCLPYVMMVMRELNMTEVEGMDRGGRAEEISNIPVFRFKQSASSDHHAQQQQSQSSGAGVTTKATDKKGLLSKLLKGYRNHGVRDPEISEEYEDIYITPADNALCCICLSEYEESDLLCRLWCGHHFHQSCLKEWLTLNRKCPLCKQDFRGKEYEEDSQDELEDDEEDEEQAVGNGRGETSRNGNEFQLNQLR